MKTKSIETSTISVRFPIPLWAKVKAAAERERRPANQQVLIYVEKAMKEFEWEESVIAEAREKRGPEKEAEEADGTADTDSL